MRRSTCGVLQHQHQHQREEAKTAAIYLTYLTHHLTITSSSSHRSLGEEEEEYPAKMVPRSRSWFCPCSCIGGSSDDNQDQHQQQPDENNEYEIRPPPLNRSYMNGVYYPNWLVYKDKTPATLDVDNITHVFYAFVE